MRATHHQYTWHQYLVLDGDSNVKLEYFNGEIFAMAGGTPEHGALTGGVIGELRAQLEGKPCLGYTADVRVRVLATSLGTYPDVSVVCGTVEYDPEDKNTIVNPLVLVEVLSDSTQLYDRGEKFENYRQIPSLREYVLVSHRECAIEVFRRGKKDEWDRIEARTGAAARLHSLGCELEVDRIYRGISLGRT